MTKVFVSGCYDILHGGHIQFFKDARALGDHLTVCFASDETIRAYKGREPAMPQEHRRLILESLRMVDRAVMGADCLTKEESIWDFCRWAEIIQPDILAVAEADYDIDENLIVDQKCERAARKGPGYGRVVSIPKECPVPPITTTEIRQRIAGNRLGSELIFSRHCPDKELLVKEFPAMPIRLFNVLVRANITTVADIWQHPDLKTIKGIGPRVGMDMARYLIKVLGCAPVSLSP